MEARKSELIEWIKNLENPQLLNNLIFLKENQGKADWWESISEQEREKIQQGLKDHDLGNIIAAEDLWAKSGK